MSLSHLVFVVVIASTAIAVADGDRPAAKDAPSKSLFTFEPLGKDKDKIPDGKATLAIVEGRLTAFATGFTLISEAIPMPADGKVVFELQGVADNSLVVVSVNDREIWSYEGDEKNLVSSPTKATSRSMRSISIWKSSATACRREPPSIPPPAKRSSPATK